jgi:hypothetical protein
VRLEVVTIDTDTTVHTLYGQQMGGRKSYKERPTRLRISRGASPRAINCLYSDG